MTAELISTPGEWLLTLAPVIGLTSALLAHLLVRRYHSKLRMVPGLLAAAAVGAGVLLFVSGFAVRQSQLLWLDLLGRFVTACFAFNALFYLYASCFIALASSIRIQTLARIRNSHPSAQALHANQLEQQQLALERLSRLVNDGRLAVRGNRYFSRSDWLLQVSRVYSMWRLVLFRTPYLADIKQADETLP